MSLAHQPIGAFLEELAAKTPTPGGGAVAALTGAMAAGLAEMVLNYSLIKRLDGHRAEIARALTVIGEIRIAFLGAADEDARAYQRLNDAMKVRDRNSEEEREFRAALIAATAAPGQVIKLSLRLLEGITELGDRWNHNLASDLAMAAILAGAAARSAWWNVQMNRPMLQKAEMKQDLVTGAAADLARVEDAAARVESAARDIAKP